ncbi:MAG: winged helix-turn-helix transcriptional regulator [Candidatus Micrarchaeota archaeon]|nr:winged helix-turn-helix transcriptional regulator [Candidatus Micrarchaeota archaeon]
MEELLDIKDKKILYELDMGARQSLSAIAKKVGLSREVVYYRIQQLEKKGVIEGYYTALDVSKLGLIYCRFFLKYRVMLHESEEKLLEYCKKSSLITWVALGEGKWDITIVILAKNLGEIETLYDDLSSKFGAYFQNPYLTIAFRIYHYKHNYLYGTEDTKELILGENIPVKVDHIDLAIIHVLSSNARMSIIDIAKKLSNSPKTVDYRIRNLIKKEVIIGFRTKLNTRLLGYDHQKVFLTLQNFTKEKQKKLHTYLRLHPSVIYITKPMGMHNLEFEIMVKGTNELHEFIREFKSQFSDIIIDYDTMLNYAEPLLEYIPKV